MSRQHQQQQQHPPSQNDGCSVMHSFPFIHDGPKTNNTYGCHPSRQQHQKEAVKSSIAEKPGVTRQVPPGAIHIKPTWKPVKLDEKPPFSYATIIAHAILSSDSRRLTLSEIYQWISEQYPCYNIKDHRWQNSIRHNLSLQKAFVKLERDTNTPSGKGCFWTMLPGYEQQFIDNLVKRGMGNTVAGCPSSKKHASSGLCSTSTSKQFRKFIDTSVNNNSPLFTIFRMNPTTNTENPSKKRKRTLHTKKKEIKHEEPELRYDSDCDSGVDLGCEMYPKKPKSQDFMCSEPVPTTSAPVLSAQLPPLSPPSPLQTQSYNRLLVQDSMLIPDELFTTQQSNSVMMSTSNDTDRYFDNISAPSSIIMDQQQLFSNESSNLVNWPQSSDQQASFCAFQQSSHILDTPNIPQDLSSFYAHSSASFASFGTDSHSSNTTYLLPHQPFQDYYLYNDFC